MPRDFVNEHALAGFEKVKGMAKALACWLGYIGWNPALPKNLFNKIFFQCEPKFYKKIVWIQN